MQDLLTGPFPQAAPLPIVMDPLNTHHPASLYAAVQPAEANALLERWELHYPPKHGSGRTMAASACSALQRQGVDRRIPAQATVRAEGAA